MISDFSSHAQFSVHDSSVMNTAAVVSEFSANQAESYNVTFVGYDTFQENSNGLLPKIENESVK